ncbi:MAG: four helix bundle protein [Chloroflexi bacterium]|nr:four helix bundle protein [Chloroflexota bacterium]
MNNMENDAPQDLRTRTSDFALKIIRLYTSLPKITEAQVIGKQVLRSGTSIGAHYREGHRAKSDADIVNKFVNALQELDETDYWLELLTKGGIVPALKIEPLRKETNELLAIFTTIVTKIKKRMIKKQEMFWMATFILHPS